MTAANANVCFWDDGCAVFLDRESQTVILDAAHAGALRQLMKQGEMGSVLLDSVLVSLQGDFISAEIRLESLMALTQAITDVSAPE